MINQSAPGARVALSAILGLTLVGTPGVAAAQNTRLAPLYGSRAMSYGFRPDPHEVTVRAGGPANVEGRSLPEACRGHITEAATYEVRWTAGGVSPLIFRTASDADTTLLVNGPDGRLVCDDDSGPGLAAEVVFETPTSGVYDVWVGRLAEGTAAATLSVSELRSSADEDEWDDEAWEEEEDEPTPQPSNISIKACNDSGMPAVVAVSYVPEGQTRFATRGWFAIASGACSTLATTMNRSFYLYGVTTDGSNREWSGDIGTCVRYPDAFFEYVPTGNTCLPGQVVRQFHTHAATAFGETVWRMP
ncbi:MAG: DUF1036 domain-containing protein [Brevundimonas sp.]|uniref:DUF1036 domain-containing protein n=1 Tax=Brevundimonas sp. TaxID=1871086 RepID=UPI0024888F68|nr:DUF1036 domain-containing protein [Brevundimonas sp.]MDI1328423.1 DUF1036 domain-containing protein [Brevundimonas sp.]